jgi:hypothetical protein
VRRVIIRLALLVSGVPSLATGAWGLFAPHSFYTSYPGGAAHAWIAASGPYDEHLIRDFGGLLLALNALIIFAAVILERRVVIATAGASLVFAVPHLIYHVAHVSDLRGVDRVLNLALLVAAVTLMVAVIGLAVPRTGWERN